MSSIKSFTLIILIGIAVAGLSVSSARAAVVLDVVGGELFGAQNVDVNGTFFDVAFGDGSCITLFDGCNAVSDFALSSLAEATAAGQALLDQVLLDGGTGNFDTVPALTNGCGDSVFCSLVVIYAFVPSTLNVLAIGVDNFRPPFEGPSLELVVAPSNTTNFATFGPDTNSFTQAVFSLSTNGGVNGNGVSPVPLPAALPLFGSALAMLGIVGWRRKRRAAA